MSNVVSLSGEAVLSQDFTHSAADKKFLDNITQQAPLEDDDLNHMYHHMMSMEYRGG